MTEADQKTSEHDTCIRCLVFGKVQGVFFRASTQKIATELGLVGYAKNMYTLISDLALLVLMLHLCGICRKSRKEISGISAA